MINKNMDEIKELKKIIEQHEKQLLALKKAVDILSARLVDTDKRTRRNTENLRHSSNDINNIKRKLRS
jgi:transcriptional regulator of met regulon